MVIGPLGLAFAVGAGSVISSALSWWNQRRSERLQTDLANSAVQRRVADLRAAGINPILAAQGQGAPVPSVQPVRFENPMEAAAETYVSARRLSNESSLVEEQRAKLRADTDVSRETLINMREQVKLIRAQVENTGANTATTWKKMTELEFWQQLWRVAGNTISRYLGSRKEGQDAEGAFGMLVDQLAKEFGVERRMSPDEVMKVWEGVPTVQSSAGGLRGRMSNDKTRGGASGGW